MALAYQNMVNSYYKSGFCKAFEGIVVIVLNALMVTGDHTDTCIPKRYAQVATWPFDK